MITAASGKGRAGNLIFIMLLISCLVFLSSCTGRHEASRSDEGVILVLGKGFTDMNSLTNPNEDDDYEYGRQTMLKILDEAEKQHNLTGNRIIVSGYKARLGVLSKNQSSESAVMKNFLIQKGVPAEDIIEENRSRETAGEMIFAGDMCRGRFGDITIIISKDHEKEAKLFAGRFLRDYEVEWMIMPPAGDESFHILPALRNIMFVHEYIVRAFYSCMHYVYGV